MSKESLENFLLSLKRGSIMYEVFFFLQLLCMLFTATAV